MVVQGTFTQNIEKARTASKKGDITVFAQCLQDALLSFTSAFYNKNFKRIIKEDKLEQFFKAICAGVDGSGLIYMINVWVDCYLYSCKSHDGSVQIEDMEDLLDRMEEFPELTKNVNRYEIANSLISMGVFENDYYEPLESGKTTKIPIFLQNHKRRMGFDLDEKQKNMMNSMAKYEIGDNCGGIITIATATNDRIEEVLMSHIFEQNKTLENGSKPNKTLMVGSPSWTNKLQKLPSKCKKVPEECSQNSQNDALSFYKLKKTTKSQDFANCKEDIVLANYGLLETIQELKVTWERIIFHDFSLETKNNYQQFETVCKLNATFRWYITENHKQGRLVEYLVADDGKRMHVKGDIDTFLDQANLYLPSAEPKSRNLKTPLDGRQKDFKSSLAQRENEPVRGGVITTLIRDILIKEAIIEFLLDQKNTSEEYGHSMGKTLLLVPPDMIESWKKLLEKLLEKDDLVIHYFCRNEDKKPDDSHEVVITTYDMLKNIENRSILWKRIIFEDNYSASEKDWQQYQLFYSFLCQLHAEYRWCLTGNPTQQKLARFMNRKEYGESHNLIKSISLGNAKDDEEKSTAKLVKNIETKTDSNKGLQIEKIEV